MSKKLRLWTGWILCLSLMLTTFSTTWAAEKEDKKEKNISIETAEEFAKFAENCRLDSYSENLNVQLEADIDLAGIGFNGIPTFSGTFDGNEHVISGLNIQTEGSVQGFFRYVRAGATVKNLKLEGNIAPTGSRSSVGSLAGENAGSIINCSFSGSVSGTDRVGGLVGYNQLTGVIEACSTSGQIQGDHFIGGLAGENNGVIRQCENMAKINTTVQENTVELSDISLDSLLESESAVTVTDVGGIAGSNMGVIRECENRGSVGYPKIGYNIGGIAGSQSGYIVDCINRGEIMGRKEVGGIVGQMEPVMRMEFDEDTLQKLQTEMDTMMGLTGKTMATAQGSIADVSSQISALEGHVKDAQKALDQMTPNVTLPEDPAVGNGELDLPEVEVPDLDAVLAAQNNLSSSIGSIPGTVDDMVSSAKSTLGAVSSSLQALSNQMNVIGNTMKNAEEDLGGSLVDASDADTAEDTNGKVEACANFGGVVGDLNVGGIVGAMSFESSLDPELDMEIAGDLSMNFEGEVRVVTLQCQNYAAVTVNKQNGGGIAGRMGLGLVRECENRGSLQGEAASYLGGITGRSDSGFIRENSVRCSIAGSEYIGGIAGTAAVVSDCSSMTKFSGGAEKMGGVLGCIDEVTEKIENNYYLPIEGDMGGIDGISYDGSAQALDEESFFELKNLPEDFKKVSVRFLGEDGSEEMITLNYGEALQTERIPAVPEKDGHSGYWDGLEELDLAALYFDVTLRAAYDAYETVIASAALRADDRPILLVSSRFGENAQVVLSELTDVSGAVSENEKMLEAWNFELTSQGENSKLRYLPAEAFSAAELMEDEAKILVRDAAGAWRSVFYTVDGSYFVFEINEGDNGFCLIQNETVSWLLYGLIGAGVVLIASTVMIVAVMKRRKKNSLQKEKA